MRSSDSWKDWCVPERLDGRAGVVRGQFQQPRYLFELLLPVGELPVPQLTDDPLALPGCPIDILDGQVWQRRLPGGMRPIERDSSRLKTPRLQPSETM